MMSETEVLWQIVLTIGFGFLAYIAGKGDLLNLIPLMLQEKAKEIEEALKEGENDG